MLSDYPHVPTESDDIFVMCSDAFDLSAFPLSTGQAAAARPLWINGHSTPRFGDVNYNRSTGAALADNDLPVMTIKKLFVFVLEDIVITTPSMYVSWGWMDYTDFDAHHIYELTDASQGHVFEIDGAALSGDRRIFKGRRGLITNPVRNGGSGGSGKVISAALLSRRKL